MSKFHRSYGMTCEANAGKVDTLWDLTKVYRKSACLAANRQWKHFLQEGFFNKNLATKDCHDWNLLARYRQTLQYQVVGQLKSWVSNRANEFEELVRHSNLDDEIRWALLKINSKQHWFHPEIRSSELGKLARLIWKRVCRRHQRPSYDDLNPALDAKVAVIEKSTKGPFDYWIRISTLNSGHPVYVPIKSNDYFEEEPGKHNNFCHLVWGDPKSLTIRFDRESEIAAEKEGKKQVALDLGLRTLFATNYGDLLGRRWIDDLIWFDTQIQRLEKELRKQGIPLKSNRRYQRLHRVLKQRLKNGIGYHLNRMLEIHKPDQIIIERLDFQNSNLSRRMNRLLSNFGKSIIKSKLNAIKESQGIQVIEVNPAYSSQQCSRCGYIAKNNRQNEAFECKFCGFQAHADVVGGQNLIPRSSWGDKINGKRKGDILQILVDKFLLDLERSNRLSAALPLLQKNPYYKDHPLVKKKASSDATPSSRLRTCEIASQGLHRSIIP